MVPLDVPVLEELVLVLVLELVVLLVVLLELLWCPVVDEEFVPVVVPEPVVLVLLELLAALVPVVPLVVDELAAFVVAFVVAVIVALVVADVVAEVVAFVVADVDPGVALVPVVALVEWVPLLPPVVEDELLPTDAVGQPLASNTNTASTASLFALMGILTSVQPSELTCSSRITAGGLYSHSAGHRGRVLR